MAAGDLVVANYQYEYNNLLMGANTAYTVEGVEGLWEMPEIRSGDLERIGGHGDIGGEDWMGARRLTASIKAWADTQSAMESSMIAAAKAFQVRSSEIPFVWQRPGQVKKYVNARPRKRSFPTNYNMARGLSEGTVELYCPDPTIYALTAKTVTITLPAGTASGSATATNAGDWETWPHFTLTGAGSNPRFTNREDSSRQVRIDVSMNSSDTLMVDTHPARRTVTLNGTDRYDLVRNDNQWWRLMEDANLVTFSRTGTTGSQTLTVKWNDAWI